VGLTIGTGTVNRARLLIITDQVDAAGAEHFLGIYPLHESLWLSQVSEEKRDENLATAVDCTTGL